MAVIVGIDEAGYGPILGPLVVSAAVFRLPDDQLNTPMWDLLRSSVCKKRAGSAGRIAINDSKKLHSGLGDYQHLQRGVLAGLKQIHPEKTWTNLGDLLDVLDPDCRAKLKQYRWYEQAETAALIFDDGDIASAAQAWQREMQQQAMSILGTRSRILLAKEYNQQVATIDNKARMLFSVVCQLIHRAWQKYGRDNLQIVIDKQSGRSHYRRPLQQMFPDMQMKVIREDEQTSSYQMTDSSGGMKIHFLRKGDSRQLPIALASMTSKYLRELLIKQLNAWFQQRCPDLKPTAGYYQDGVRFLNDLKAHNIDIDQFPREKLVRAK